MIRDPQVFFEQGCGRCARFATADCSAARWREGLLELRALCLGLGLTEAAKWGHPCYMHAGRNIAVLGAFRDDFRLSFFNAGLLQDKAGLLQRQGENTQHPDAAVFRSRAEIAPRIPALTELLRQAMAAAAAGIRPDRTPQPIEMPDVLAEALTREPDLARAFAALTPGRQRSHALAIGSAKAVATRQRRLEALRPRILAGKGATE